MKTCELSIPQTPTDPPIRLSPRWYIEQLHHRIALGRGVLLLTQVGRCFVAADAAAELVSDAIGSPIVPVEIAGERVRVTAVADDAIDAVVDALTDAGHALAVAVPVEDEDPTGHARTAIVRNYSGGRAGALKLEPSVDE